MTTDASPLALGAARRADFPLLRREQDGKRLVYLDSASSAQKPQAVMCAMDELMERSYANVHRGVYAIAEETTARFEAARLAVARFVGARESAELIFTRNATEAINLVAYSWARANLHEGDVIVLSEMEHHANVIPWHMLAAERGVELRWIPLTTDYRLDLTDLDALLAGAKLLAISAMSNVLGTVNDIPPLVAAARAVGAHVLVDASQAAPHLAIDVQAWDADFVAITAHKMLGPSVTERVEGVARQALLVRVDRVHADPLEVPDRRSPADGFGDGGGAGLELPRQVVRGEPDLGGVPDHLAAAEERRHRLEELAPAP